MINGTCTVCIQIGNSDNKLTQNEWAHYCDSVRQLVHSCVREVHFSGGSDWDAPWQNACWVAVVGTEKIEALKKQLRMVRQSYSQESIAIVCGQTEFV